MTVPLAVFGPGILIITQGGVSNPTPVNVGYAQEFSYDEAAETKELYGQNQYPLAAARGTIKSTGKIKAATLSGIALNAAFNGQSFTAGQLIMQYGESHAIPATPYQVVIAPPASGTFESDLGVLNASTGLPLVKVALASTPTTGQYHVDPATGTYTFAAADTTNTVLVTYAYTVSATGQKQIIANQPIGTSPYFQIDYSSILNGQPYYIRFFNCIATKLTRAHKLTDFVMPEIDISFFANATGQVYEVSYPMVA